MKSHSKKFFQTVNKYIMSLELEQILVESSVIKSISYDYIDWIMYVIFIGDKEYEYYSVPEKVFTDFVNSESKGQYFNSNIKYKFSFNRLL